MMYANFSCNTKLLQFLSKMLIIKFFILLRFTAHYLNKQINKLRMMMLQVSTNAKTWHLFLHQINGIMKMSFSFPM